MRSISIVNPVCPYEGIVWVEIFWIDSVYGRGDLHPTFSSGLTLKIPAMFRTRYKISNPGNSVFCFLSPSCLGIDMKSGAILPLWHLDSDIPLWRLGAPIAEMSHQDQCDMYPTLDVSAPPWVGLLLLGLKADG